MVNQMVTAHSDAVPRRNRTALARDGVLVCLELDRHFFIHFEQSFVVSSDVECLFFRFNWTCPQLYTGIINRNINRILLFQGSDKSGSTFSHPVGLIRPPVFTFQIEKVSNLQSLAADDRPASAPEPRHR